MSNKSHNMSNKSHNMSNKKGKVDNIKEEILDIKPTVSPSFSVGNSSTPMKKTTPKKVLTPKKTIYQNTALKSALLKQSIPSHKIDETMIKLKITQSTNITKELINHFIRSIKF